MKVLLRLSVYLIVIILFSFSIYSRFNEIEQEKKLELNSFPKYYTENGFPVKVYKLTRKDLTLKKKISAKIIGSNKLQAKIDRSIKKKIKINNIFNSKYLGHQIHGKVTFVSNKISFVDGLFTASFETDKPLPFKEGLIPLNINIGKIKNILILPTMAIIPQNDKFYVWVAQNNLSVKKEVKIKHYNQTEVEIEGLSENELVIIEGQNKLNMNTKLAIIGQN